MKFVLIVLALAVSLSMAGVTANGGSESGVSYWQGTDVEDIYWSQDPTGGLNGSQYFDDLFPDYDAGVADDFQFASTTIINKVRWWGGYWNQTTPHIVESPVEIYLYLDDGTGVSPTLPQHTSAIDSWFFDWGAYTEVVDGDYYVYEYVFPEWVVLDADTHYWMEIRKCFPFDPDGQWGWCGHDPIVMSPAVQGFDGLGIDWWTPLSGGTDVAFELIFDDEQALTNSTWGDIKTVF